MKSGVGKTALIATARTAGELFPLASAANDKPTVDLLTHRLEVHEKTAWMLRSLRAV